MASGPITSWQIDGETMKTVTDFIFLGSKITEDSNCSHEFKRHLLLRRKAMTNLDSILKSREITLPTKVHIVKATFLRYSQESFPTLQFKSINSSVLSFLYGPTLTSMTGKTKPVNCKGNQSLKFIGRTDAGAKAT